MKTKKLKKLTVSRETLRTLEGQQMRTLVAGGSGCPTCETCQTCPSCYGTCGTCTCYDSCAGTCDSCGFATCTCP